MLSSFIILLILKIPIYPSCYIRKDGAVTFFCPVEEGNVNEVIVTRVVDGDTIEIEGGKKVRYIGIDTPETSHPSKPVECYGKEATDKNRELVEGKMVVLEKDISETDRYGRLLRYVWVNGEMVNELLVRQGFAQVSTYPPDVKYQQLFLEGERIAREEMLGFWGSCINEIGSDTQ